MEYRRHNRFARHIISAPFIYGMFVPLILLDLVLEIYHQVCFRLYGLERVRRSAYIRMDRHRLQYLNWYEKINCAYCGYANGLLQYAARIAGDTERYWCGIKHQKTEGYTEPPHHKDFLKYGDKKAYERIRPEQ
jgi:hypothetical protein